MVTRRTVYIIYYFIQYLKILIIVLEISSFTNIYTVL